VDWEAAIDKKVFDEQLQTGLFRGRPLDSTTLLLLQAAKERDQVTPYYGAGGSGGACMYSLRQTGAGYVVEAENVEIGDCVQFRDASGSVQVSVIADLQMVFRIDGQEFENLKRWIHWSDGEAFTSRYVYRFGRVSLGRLGYTVRIEDTLTDNELDVTDYDDW
jgi:hypothetical protein